MKSAKPSSSRWARLLLILAIGAVALATLAPTDDNGAIPFTCIACGEVGTVEFIWNVFLFIPFGFAAVRTSRSVLVASLSALGLSIAVESIQFFAIPGRDAALGDLLANAIGGWIGAVIGRHLMALIKPSPGVARRLAAATSVTALAILGLGWRLSDLDLPNDPWYGQLAPVLGQYSTFPGRVLRATVNRAPVPIGLIGDWDRLRRGALTDGIVLETRLVTGAPTPALAPVVSIFDAHQRRVLLLGQDGRDLRFEVRLRSESVRLRAPGFVARRVIPSRAGDTVDVRAVFARGRYELQVATRGQEHAILRRFTLSPAIGWAFIAPRSIALGLPARVASLVWVLLLAGPPIYFARRARRIPSTS
ncbi:MAG: VanZ family protein [Gemmatimonadota bacterium]